MTVIEVAAAIIANDRGQILIARRKAGKAQGGLWEFPGGKLEPGESAAECLKRELMEEMGIGIRPTALFGVNEHDYGSHRIRLTAYEAEYEGGPIVLVDHDEYRWADLAELGQFAFAPADVPFIERLRRFAK
ncbi:8-oxo-dGTP diphosphatase MutT [Gorillibacterium sp. sgz500922]|uniref:8-oxo-dGTP diphosphatase MutT n=1 Tax=Gorillibacterium sp. sgz500922 TaxID=3446694 RepID=UPI003F663B4C